MYILGRVGDETEWPFTPVSEAVIMSDRFLFLPPRKYTYVGVG